MSNVKVILRTERADDNNQIPLRIRVIKDRKVKCINLGISILAEQWDEKKQRVKKNHPNAGRYNAFIAKKVAEAEGLALEMLAQNKYIHSFNLKESMMGKGPVEFFPYANQFASLFQVSGKIGSHRRAKSVIAKLSEYVEGSKICFDQITVGFLKNYELYLLSKCKNKANTIHANFRLLRTIFNNAVREDLIPADINPFNKMKLKAEQTQRAFLTEAELMKLEALQLQSNYMINHHRNMYVFSAYAGGLRISDVLQMRWKYFDGEKITIKIHKTQTPLSIKLPERALQIIGLYQKESNAPGDFIFPLLKISPDEKNPEIIHTAISSASAYTNKDLKKLGEMAGIEKHLSFHTSRHTWATRALTKGMRIEHVSKLMGHAAIKETQIYAKIVNAELDKAMAVFN